MIRFITILLLSTTLLFAAGYEYKKYKQVSESGEYEVTGLHYDRDLNMIVFHIRVEIWPIHINGDYGVLVKDSTDIEKNIQRMVGNPEIVKLKEVE